MKRPFIPLLIGCVWFVLAVSTAAQDENSIPYTWAETGLSFSYPAGWDTPYTTVDEDGRFVLILAQIMASSPDTRPPGVPVMTLTLLPNTEPVTDFAPFISDAFSQLGLTPGETAPGTLLGLDALTAQGASDDALLFGLTRAAALHDNSIVLVTGRAPEAQRAVFTPLYNALADSLTMGDASVSSAPAYGVMWNTTRTLADGENAFVSLAGLQAHDGKLYSTDLALGIVIVDATTGAVLENIPNADMLLPSSLAIGNDGTVYVADTACQCIFVLSSEGVWNEPITGFEVQSPASIAITPDGALYATELTVSGVQVRVHNADQETIIPFGPEVVEQPLLAVDSDGQVIALTQDGLVMAVSNADLAPLATLNLSTPLIQDFDFLEGTGFVLATIDSGVLVISPDGEQVESLGRIVANFPLPGEFVHPNGVAVGADGSIYIADSDGSFGSITAMNTRVATGRVGSTVLIPGVAVQGTLNAETPSQDWTLNGIAGQSVTISAIDDTGTGILDVGLKLIAPDGTEEAANDDQVGADLATPVDAQIADHELAQSGAYTVRAEIVNGEGTYRLGIVQELPFVLGADGITRIQGEIESALPKQRWTFQGAAGQVLTITMLADSGTLDPLLRLIDSNGQVISENDDAADAALGKNAQLVQVRLPANGVYTLEATRFDGVGHYTINIVVTA
jgi:sugar lactone lactonase YvrE